MAEIKWSDLPSDVIDDQKVLEALEILSLVSAEISALIQADADFRTITNRVTRAKVALGCVSSAMSVKFLTQLAKPT